MTTIESKKLYIEHGLGILSLLLCNYGDFLTGYLTTLFSYVFKSANFLMILLPIFMNLRGCVYVAYSTRIITKLRLGVIEPRKFFQRGLLVEIKIAYAVSLISRIIVGIIIALIVGLSKIDVITSVALISGIIGVSIVVPLSTLGFFEVYKRDISPETLAGPLESVIGDVITIPTLLIAYLITEILYNINRLVLVLLLTLLIAFTIVLVRSTISEEGRPYTVWSPRKTIIENTVASVVASLIELIVGLKLASQLTTLTTYKVLLFAIFPTMAVVGGIAVRYTAYLNSGLHLGNVEHSCIPRGLAVKYYYRSMLLSFAIYVNVIAMSVMYALANHEPLALCAIPLISGTISTTIMLYVTYLLSILVFRKGMNPANIATSLIMPLSDLTTVLIYMGLLTIIR